MTPDRLITIQTQLADDIAAKARRLLRSGKEETVNVANILLDVAWDLLEPIRQKSKSEKTTPPGQKQE